MSVPGDKSISHRCAMVAALAEGTSEIQGFATNQDCRSTLDCLEKMGIEIEQRKATVRVHGRGLDGLKSPRRGAVLYAGNSGSTMRLISGILAGQSFRSVIDGDQSLSLRPMSRVVNPLEEMGAQIKTADGGRPPLEIQGRPLHAVQYELPVPSSQVKSAVLLAGLFAPGETRVIEPIPTRDHTEILLEQFGADIGRHQRIIAVQGRPRLEAQSFQVPGDISSAAFLLAAALIVSGSDLVIQNVGLNPTRTALLDVLVGAGGYIKILNVEMINGELVGDLHVEASHLKGVEILPEMVAGVIDELPMLAVVGTQTDEGFFVRSAGELRLKESDRIKTVVENLRRMGAEVEEFPDGMRVPGRQKLHGADIDSQGDHRIAMAFAIAGLVADSSTSTRIRSARCVNISFPGFFKTLRKLVN